MTVGRFGGDVQEPAAMDPNTEASTMARKTASAAAEAPERPQQRRNREGEMMRAALKLFSQKGYSAASMQDLANVIGVLKGSLYHYVDSKEDLLFQIFHDAHLENEALMEEVAALDVEPEERLRIYLERSLHTTLRNIERTALYFRDWRYLTGERRKILARQRAQYEQFLRDLILAAHEARGVKASADPKHISSFIIGATNWVADWYNAGSEDTIDDVAANYTSLAMAAIMGVAEAPEAPARRRQKAR